MIEIELPDGTIAEFPDGMPDAEIQSVLQRQFGGGQQQPAVQAEPSPIAPQGSTIESQRAAALGVQPIPDPVLVSRSLPPEIANLPELQSSGLLAGESFGRTAAISPALLTATDPNEIVKIITSNYPDIGVTYNKDETGTLFPVLRNNKTGAATLINKPGLSGLDVIQGLGIAAAFTPAGKAATAGKAFGAAAATQGGIEAVQAASGGDFNAAQIPIAGAAGLVGQQVASKATQYFSKPTAAQQKIVELIEQNADDVQRAGFTIKQTDFGLKPVKQAAAQELKKQGLDDGTISLIQSSSASDKLFYKKAIDILKGSRSSKTYAVANRPGDAAGEVLKQRYDAAKSINQQAGKEIEVAARELSGKTVNLAPAYDEFFNSIQDLGVSIVRGEKGKLKGIYENSELALSKSSQKILNNFIKKYDESTIDALDAHTMKRVIDGAVEYGKKNPNPILSKAESALKTLRRGVNESLQELSPAYKAANTKYADTRQALDQFADVAGPSFNPASDNAEKQLVSIARTIMSNNKSRVPALDAINALQETSKKYGVKFDNDILKQAAFMDELEKLFGSAAPTSFGGQIERFADRAIEMNAGGIAKDLVKEGVKKARGINEENLIKAFEEMLK